MTDEQFEKLLEAVHAITEYESPTANTSLLDIYTLLEKMNRSIEQVSSEVDDVRRAVDTLKADLKTAP